MTGAAPRTAGGSTPVGGQPATKAGDPPQAGGRRECRVRESAPAEQNTTRQTRQSKMFTTRRALSLTHDDRA